MFKKILLFGFCILLLLGSVNAIPYVILNTTSNSTSSTIPFVKYVSNVFEGTGGLSNITNGTLYHNLLYNLDWNSNGHPQEVPNWNVTNNLILSNKEWINITSEPINAKKRLCFFNDTTGMDDTKSMCIWGLNNQLRFDAQESGQDIYFARDLTTNPYLISDMEAFFNYGLTVNGNLNITSGNVAANAVIGNPEVKIQTANPNIYVKISNTSNWNTVSGNLTSPFLEGHGLLTGIGYIPIASQPGLLFMDKDLYSPSLENMRGIVDLYHNETLLRVFTIQRDSASGLSTTVYNEGNISFDSNGGGILCLLIGGDWCTYNADKLATLGYTYDLAGIGEVQIGNRKNLLLEQTYGMDKSFGESILNGYLCVGDYDNATDTAFCDGIDKKNNDGNLIVQNTINATEVDTKDIYTTNLWFSPYEKELGINMQEGSMIFGNMSYGGYQVSFPFDGISPFIFYNTYIYPNVLTAPNIVSTNQLNSTYSYITYLYPTNIRGANVGNIKTLNSTTIKLASATLPSCSTNRRMMANNDTGLYYCNSTDWHILAVY